LDNPNDSEDNCTADIESDIEQDNAIEVTEYPEQRDVSAGANVPGSIWLTWQSKGEADKVLVTVNAIETEEEYGSDEKVGLNASMFHQLLYLS